MRWTTLLSCMLVSVGCTDYSSGLTTRYEAGRRVFSQNCVSCHGSNAAGGFGPDIRGSSLQLVKLKVTKGKYPDGYKPKRESSAMPQFPWLEKDVPDLYCYLNEKCK